MKSEFDSRRLKGEIGEAIVDEYLIKRGWIPYHPVFEGPHPFDRLVASRDKQKLLIVEVKSKPRRECYEDTGINARHYREYTLISATYSIPVFIAFVDEVLGRIYGNFLAELDQRDGVYPKFENGIVYFPLVRMIPVAPLTAEQCEQLRALRQTKFKDRRVVKTNGHPTQADLPFDVGIEYEYRALHRCARCGFKIDTESCEERMIRADGGSVLILTCPVCDHWEVIEETND